MDYSYPEVRAHRLAIMRELAEQDEIDGLDLDFCRWAKHFPRDQGFEKAPISYRRSGLLAADGNRPPMGMQKLALPLPTGWTMDALHRLVSFG